ncbi:hypothetical protein V5O48_012158 [Marasmius crinis-equi]|uniref:Glutamyl-tRNA(Gln) amidotransferase subunit B, mitochondrial n=1 Tax=Marasmius crinis-equi TaxID=585013 RepID=A0ABR3F3J6_9AGAR
MAKRKASSDNEDEFEESDASREATPPPKKKAGTKKPKVLSIQFPTQSSNLAHLILQYVEEEQEEEEEKPKSKSKAAKPSSSKGKATQKTASTSDDGEVTVQKTSEGDSYVDLGKKKRATVRSFKGKALVDIREFYGADGDEKPGKKGISLTEEQIKSRQKLFSRAPTALLNAPPNSRYNAFDAAFPGTLPKLNTKCLELAIRAALALKCDVRRRSTFDRKHYFYSDQPVGYQITQHYSPLALNGTLVLPKLGIPIRIKQIQLEQDTGKSIFDYRTRSSLIDLNRAGTGLLEIVTEPDLRTPEEAAEYVRSLQSLLRSMGVSDGNMEAGSLRCDINVSMNRPGEPFGTRCEIKNVNSVRFMVAAIQHEIERQKNILSSRDATGSPLKVSQETRGFDEDRWETYTIRSKEDAPDYRYMPDPNLGTLVINEYTIEDIRKNLPSTPEATRKRLIDTYGPKGVTSAAVDVLMGLDSSQDVPFDGETILENENYSMSAVAYFECLCEGRDPREVINWITQTLVGLLASSGKSFSSGHISVLQTGALIDLVSSGSMTRSSARLLLRHLIDNPQPNDTSIQALAQQLDLLSGSELSSGAKEDDVYLRAIDALPSEVAAIRSGNKNVLNKLIGWVMRETKGKADVKKTRERLECLISKI